ncbi:MAG TPA: EamA family transporter [Dehalococcoidia bacterium]
MGELAGLVAAFLWSLTSVLLTALSARTPPPALSALRLAIAAVTLAGAVLVTGRADAIWAAPPLTVLAMAGSGLIGYGVGDTAYIRALSLLGMQQVFPISMALFLGLTVLGGVVLLDEPFTWGLPLGGLLIGAGISLLVVVKPGGAAVPVPAAAAPEPAAAVVTGAEPRPVAGAAPAARPGGVRRGYLSLLAAGLFWAAATLWLAAGRGDLDALAISALRAPAGAAGLLAFVLATRPRDLATPFLSVRHAASLVAAGLLGTGFGSLLYVYSVAEAGAARAALLSATAPLMALPLSIFVLGERLTAPRAAGTVLCVLGIMLVVS